MRRTQLYLDDELWNALHARARSEKTTISDLVRQAVRDRYVGNHEKRKRAMQAVVGLWKGRADVGQPDSYIRELRRDTRHKRLTRD